MIIVKITGVCVCLRKGTKTNMRTQVGNVLFYSFIVDWLIDTITLANLSFNFAFSENVLLA